MGHILSRRLSNGSAVRIDYEDLGEALLMPDGSAAYSTRFRIGNVKWLSQIALPTNRDHQAIREERYRLDKESLEAHDVDTTEMVIG